MYKYVKFGSLMFNFAFIAAGGGSSKGRVGDRVDGQFLMRFRTTFNVAVMAERAPSLVVLSDGAKSNSFLGFMGFVWFGG